MQINPWFKCICGKTHTANYITLTTVCSCGELLLKQIPIRNVRGTIDNKPV